MGQRQSRYYCGNNGAATRGKPVGTRVQCLRIGIGKGSRLPCTESYAGEYQPIDTRRVYCGDQDVMPDEYDLLGSPSMCLKTGIGIGKAQRARRGCNSILRMMLFVLLWLALTTGVTLYIYYSRLEFVLSTDANGNRYVDGNKLAIYSGIASVILGGVVFGLYLL